MTGSLYNRTGSAVELLINYSSVGSLASYPDKIVYKYILVANDGENNF